MTAYRMYFYIIGEIHGRQDFEADGDVAAIRIARVLYDTCSDTCDSFGLCQGGRQLPAQQPHHQKANLADLIEDHQLAAIETEETISQSKWIIAHSRRLLDTLDRMRRSRAALRWRAARRDKDSREYLDRPCRSRRAVRTPPGPLRCEPSDPKRRWPNKPRSPTRLRELFGS
jgi:hypothetical protein